MENKCILDKQSKDYIDFCYKEYTRLAELQENHLQSAFSDIKLLGALGAMLAWKPILNSLSDRNDPVMLMLGFLALMFIALFLFFYGFMKQSVMLFYADQMKYYEKELRDRLNISHGTMFSSVINWKHWMMSIHEPIAKRFFGYFFLFVVAFPTLVILFSGPLSETYIYMSVYIMSTLLLCFLNFQCIHIITQKITERLGDT